MAEFSELVKNFNKIRDFMRDFYIYGFKSREDFSIKSARTYDNEKRRCESYLGESMKWTYSAGNKVSFVSADCSRESANPLFSAWKSKSFTANDIMLHFYILEALSSGDKTLEELTDFAINKSGRVFDLQTVRGKCNEYVELGMLEKYKKGKAFRYKIATSVVLPDEDILDAVKFFQSGTLGVIGDFILDTLGEGNDLFVFKHHYIAHTLEDGILYDILNAIAEEKAIEIILVGSKSGKEAKTRGYPVKILVSHISGRRYLCAYMPNSRRFSTYRLDAIKSVKMLEQIENFADIQDAFSRNKDKIWGVSFEGESRNEAGFSLTLHIDEEREQFLINRIKKEGRGGELERIDKNTFRFSKSCFDANEAMPWVKTFIGRIISFSATEWLEKKLNADIRRMAEMYGIGEGGKL